MQYLGLNAENFLILFVLMAIDFFTGAVKSFICACFTIKRLWVGMISKILFLLIPVIFALGIKALGNSEYNLFLGFVVDGLVLSEVFSILRNIYTIKTGKEIADFDFLSILIKIFRNKILNGLEDKK